jgi:endonuclease G, mitochondrial
MTAHPATRMRAAGMSSAMLLVAAFVLVTVGAAPARADVSAADAKSGIVECTQALLNDHNPGLAGDPDRLICFEGYVSNFDTKPVKIGNKQRFLGVPHWIAHHVLRDSTPPVSGPRPNTWFTVPELADTGVAPIDDSYAFSQAFLKMHKNWYQRGHLAQKYLVERRGKKAALYTHNVVNAVPQLAAFNKGPWLTLECMTGAWANKYGEVWIVAGPVFKKNAPFKWLHSDKNRKAVAVAIPPFEFKIVLRKTAGNWDALAFVYPQNHPSYQKGPFDPEMWFKSVADIEQMTGEHFLTGIPNAAALKQKTADKLWPVAQSDFDMPACRAQKTDVH